MEKKEVKKSGFDLSSNPISPNLPLSGQVKKQVKKHNFYLTSIDLLKSPISLKDIASRLQISKQRLNYYIKDLKKYGIIEKKGYGTWDFAPDFKGKSSLDILQFIEDNKTSKKSFSSGMSAELKENFKKVNLHALNINIPVLKGIVNLDGGQEYQLNNWKRQYKRIPSLKITLINNNNKSLSVNVWSREIFDSIAIPNICQATVHIVCKMFAEQDVELDYFGWRVTTFHVSMRNADLDKVLNKKMRIEVILGRQTYKITERDITQEAKAWIDSSPFKGVETNDMEFYKRYITMPDTLFNLFNLTKEYYSNFMPVMQDLTVNIKTHNKVLKDISKGFNKFNKLLSERQKKLGEWM